MKHNKEEEFYTAASQKLEELYSLQGIDFVPMEREELQNSVLRLMGDYIECKRVVKKRGQELSDSERH
ncbi:MAG: hypothetical protein WAU65_02230 [Candidatus Nanoarchaeia archaeon]